MSIHGEDMQVNGAEGEDQAPQSILVVQLSQVSEPDDRPMAQPPQPTLLVAEARPSQV